LVTALVEAAQAASRAKGLSRRLADDQP